MILNLIKYGTKFCAVEHSDNSRFFFLQLKRKRKELVLSKKGTASNFESLAQKIEGQKHLYLIINNEQVLTKKVANTNTTEERVAKAAFPNIALSDFYYDVYTNENESFISISRKEYVDGLIAQYLEHKISVIDFSLGSLVIETLVDFVTVPTITTSNAILSLEKNQVTEIEKQEITTVNYTINDLEVSNEHTLSLAGIIRYYAGIDTAHNIQKELQKEYKQKRFFDVGFKLVLGILFVSLLINYLIFSTYQSKETQYKSALYINEAKKKELTNIKELVSKKKKLVESVTSSANSKVSWYFDRISASVPGTVSLKEMLYQPVIGGVKEDKKIRFDEKTIQISGVSSHDKNFTQWITQLEQNEWIIKVFNINYGLGKKTKASFDFTIALNE
ncbi:MAG: hypothetical protein JXQ93_03365 [Flavobacteriaceae bacterium]